MIMVMKVLTTILIISFISICHINGQENTPILPHDYIKQIGKGFDANIAEFPKYMKLYEKYRPRPVEFFKQQGFNNLRIRVNNPDPDYQFMQMLKTQVQDCIDAGMYPILAYQAHVIEQQTDHDVNRIHLASWWQKMAKQFKGFSYKLSFNILIQISGTYKLDYENINWFYKSVYNRIRKHDAQRIIIFPPVKLSNPDYLTHLQIPGAPEDKYTMAQWHFYAAGPNKIQGGAKYWIDGSTQLQRDNVLNPLQVAYNWSQSTSYATWVGAWMPGNYNKGHDYTIPEQVDFASFMVRALDSKNIPWSVNADKKFYDFDENKWFTKTTDAGGLPVIHAMLNPNQIALYSQANYEGDYVRFGVGEFDQSDLTSKGFVQAFSIMIPIDYQVTFYSQAGFQGTSQTFAQTEDYLHPQTIKSIKVEYIEFSP